MSENRRVALITGAGTGVGRAVSLAFMKSEYCVVLAGRRLEKLEETIEIGGGHVDRSLAVAADVTEPSQVRDLFSKAVEKFNRLDVLFNNAGTGAPPVPLEELSLEQWQAVVSVNLTGPFLCTQEAFKIMKNQNPRGGAYCQ